MEETVKKSRVLLFGLLIVTLGTSTHNTNALSLSSWVKIGAASFAGLVGLKMLSRTSKPVYYNQKAIAYQPTLMNTLDAGLGVTIKTGVLMGGIYLFDRYFLNGTIATRIEEAKNELKEHVATRLDRLRNYLTGQLNDFRDNVDDKFSNLEDRVDRIDKTTRSTNSMLKKNMNNKKKKQ